MRWIRTRAYFPVLLRGMRENPRARNLRTALALARCMVSHWRLERALRSSQ